MVCALLLTYLAIPSLEPAMSTFDFADLTLSSLNETMATCLRTNLTLALFIPSMLAYHFATI